MESWPVFIGITVIFMGGCAFMTGQAVANDWRPARLAALYALGLALAGRFLAHALFAVPYWSATGLAADVAVLEIITLAAHRLTTARRMTGQYPWLYERTGPFSWRERGGHTIQ